MNEQALNPLSINRLAQPHRTGPLVRSHSKLGPISLQSTQSSAQIPGKRPDANALNSNAISSVAVHNLTASTLSP